MGIWTPGPGPSGGADVFEGDASSEIADGGAGNDMLNGGDGDDQLLGGPDDDALYGDAGADRLDGGTGIDQLTGGLGDDWFYVNNAADLATEAVGDGVDRVYASVSYSLQAGQEIERFYANAGATGLTLTGNELANAIYGGSGRDVLSGGAGADRIDGGAGADQMVGGTGDDFFYVDHAADRALEAAGGGDDRVYATVNYTLTAGQEIERLYANAGATALALTGNEFANAIGGGAGSDRIDGGAGADQLAGGLGDDWYYIDNAGDRVIELAGEGADRVYAAVNYTLRAVQHIERLYANAGATGLTLTGNALANTLGGGAGADVLNGGTGADQLVGGLGDDWYYVDNAGDRVIELAGEGADRVYAAVNYTLQAGQHVERLYANAGSVGLALTGNERANTLFGGAGGDRLNGGAAGDQMLGGLGDDWYYVDNIADRVTELAGGGVDRVYASANYMLTAGQEIERLYANAGATGLALTGNEFANAIGGGAGADILDGGAGVDQLLGGLGDDTYYVDNAADRVTELAGGGTDRIHASVSYALRAGLHVEQLHANAGAAGLSLTGNEIDNSLAGGAGDDRLRGGLGIDQLIGGGGADRFAYAAPEEGDDVILDFVSGTDRIEVVASAFGGGLVAGAPVTLVSGAAPVASGDAGQFLYHTTSGQLAWDADGGGAGAAVLIAQIQGAPALSASDILAVDAVAPVGVDDSVTTEEATPVAIDVLANDLSVAIDLPGVVRIAGQAVAIGSTIAVEGGEATLNADGTITYTPLGSSSGDRSFTYTIADSAGITSTANVSITVAPVAGPAAISFDETPGSIVSISARSSSPSYASAAASMSANGRYVTFESSETQFVTGDTNGYIDIFRKDLITGEIVRVSVDGAGVQADRASSQSSISSDGRYVTFQTISRFGGDVDFGMDIFRKDLITGDLVRVSANASGEPANAQSVAPAMSADGRYIAFLSIATNLVVGDVSVTREVFRKDMVTGEVVRVSADSSGLPLAKNMDELDISADGRFVVFRTEETVDYWVIHRKDLITGELITVSPPGVPLNDGATQASISGHGRFVTFTSRDSLLPEDGDALLDIYLRDLETDALTLVTSGSVGGTNSSISDNGRYVTFNSGTGLLRKDMETGEVVAVLGPGAGGISHSMSADGRLVVFSTTRGGLVPGDGTNSDVFVRDMATPFEGLEGGGVPFRILVTPVVAGETVAQVVLSGLPAGSVLSSGVSSNDGETWTFTGPPPAQLEMTPPDGYTGEFTLTVTATTQDGDDTEITVATRTVTVEPAPAGFPSGEGGAVAAPLAVDEPAFAMFFGDGDGGSDGPGLSAFGFQHMDALAINDETGYAFRHVDDWF